MSGLSEIIVAPMIVFLVIVAPIWIVMHYITRARRAGVLTDEDHSSVDQLMAAVDSMEGRLTTLESILDSEDPKWRGRS